MNEIKLSKRFAKLSTLSREVSRYMVNTRAHELALLSGRIPAYVMQADYEQAKRDVTGETELNRQNAVLIGRNRVKLERTDWLEKTWAR